MWYLILVLYMVQYEKILKFISNAKSEGATILTGGSRPKVWLYFLWRYVLATCFCNSWGLDIFSKIQWQHLNKGFFVEPTVITDVTTSMQIWREEVFGPVLCVKTFSTEEEAIDLANDTVWVGGFLCTDFNFVFKLVVLFICVFISEILWLSTDMA